MHKSAVSAIFGIILIVVIIETTALISALPPAPSGNASPFLVQLFPVVTAAPLTQKVSLQAEPIKPVKTTTTIPPNPVGNSMTGYWGDSTGVSVVPTAVPVVILTPAEPPHAEYDYPIEESDDNYSDFWRAQSIPEVTLPPEDLIEIFHQNQAYEYNTSAVTFTLKNAPMKISFNVTGRLQTDTKWTINRDNRKTTDGKLFNVTRIDPSSWFTVTIFDKDNGNTIVEKDGYGGIYDQDSQKEIVIRETGTYQIQLAGGYVNAEVVVRVPRTGNS